MVPDDSDPAWEEILARRQKMLRWLVKQGMQEPDAEDFVQETMLHARRKWTTFRGIGVDTWLHRILMNKVRDSWRRNRLTGGVCAESEWESVTAPPLKIWPCQAEPLAWLTPSVLSLLLPKGLFRFAQAFMDFNGDTAAIAEKLGINAHTARRELTRLKKHLVFDLGYSFLLEMADVYGLGKEWPRWMVRSLLGWSRTEFSKRRDAGNAHSPMVADEEIDWDEVEQKILPVANAAQPREQTDVHFHLAFEPLFFYDLQAWASYSRNFFCDDLRDAHSYLSDVLRCLEKLAECKPNARHLNRSVQQTAVL